MNPLSAEQAILDAHYMARALELARKGVYTTHPNPRVGCVIVRDGQIVGEGWHERTGEPHAEVHALRAAGDKARGATAYVTLEPCSHYGHTPPCADALVSAGLARVVAAMQDPNPEVAGRGMQRLAQAGIEVRSGVLEGEARALNKGFLKRMEHGLPFVRVKLAMSLDGRTAMASGESQWITGPAARSAVQRLRAQASVVLTGADTVLADGARLTVRADELGLDASHHRPGHVAATAARADRRAPAGAAQRAILQGGPGTGHHLRHPGKPVPPWPRVPDGAGRRRPGRPALGARGAGRPWCQRSVGRSRPEPGRCICPAGPGGRIRDIRRRQVPRLHRPAFAGLAA